MTDNLTDHQFLPMNLLKDINPDLDNANSDLPDLNTMREELARHDSENFPLEDLYDVFLNGIKGYDTMEDEEVIQLYNTIFNDW